MRALAALAAAGFLTLACSGLTDGDTVVAVEIVAPPEEIAVGDTVPVHVRALDRRGDSIPDVPIVLISLAPDTVGIDSARVAVVGLRAGTGNVVARARSLTSEPFRIIVRQP